MGLSWMSPRPRRGVGHVTANVPATDVPAMSPLRI